MPLELDGKQVKLVPISPLAQAQNLSELEAVMQFLQVAQQFGPTGAIAVNQEEAIEFIADRLGIPARILNTEEQKETIMAQMQEVQQQQAAAAAQPKEGAPDAQP
jgi:hypothetical protein